jgi:hypothetical protein
MYERRAMRVTKTVPIAAVITKAQDAGQHKSSKSLQKVDDARTKIK